MSKLYRIDINLKIDKDFDSFTEADADKIKYKVLPYLFEPTYSPADDVDGKHNQWQEEVASLYDPFDYYASYADRAIGAKRTFITCSLQDNFNSSYLHKEYEADVQKRIEWFQKNLAWTFAVEISIECMDSAPTFFLAAGNLTEKKENE